MSRNFSTIKKPHNNAPKRQISAKKSLGQNFLEDKNIVNKIVASAGLNKTATVLEIGPGLGALTLLLAYHSKKVVAVEKDNRLAEELRIIMKKLGIKNVEIINADILKELAKGRGSLFFKKLGHHYQVVANIPYYITAPLIRSLLESDPRPDEITLMVQKEVAQRICEVPPNMSLLSVAVQYYANPKILFYVSKNSFWPKPKVDSAVINLSPYRRHDLAAIKFFKIAKAGFSSPRKQLLNNLSSGLKLEKEKIKNRLIDAGLNPAQRAETLTIGDWEALSKIIYPAK
ncbi:MAG: 16S rRNA (adenine(1518)-N(6)/adenine(1519)-N(6))-dimethyltransferase RsmA [Candidatus Paceibacterota bacterium]